MPRPAYKVSDDLDRSTSAIATVHCRNCSAKSADGRGAEDAWNSRDPARVALAYTPDSRWRNRAEFMQGRPAIEQFLARKWARELDYRLIKEVWAFHDNRIALRFAYEWHDDSGHSFRSYGSENWEFNEHRLISTTCRSRLQIASSIGPWDGDRMIKPG